MLLGIFVSLTVVLASLTIGEYYQVNTLNSQLSRSSSTRIMTSVITPTVIACPSDMTCQSFTYTPISQVQVDSVQATISQPLTGERDVTFHVTFLNVGNSPIYFIGGWVNALSSSVAPNSVLQEIASPECPGAIFITTLNHGQNYTVSAPDCGTGFNYRLVHAGSVHASLSFHWTTNHEETMPFSNSTTISARFAFAASITFTSATGSSLSCKGVRFSPMVNETPTICDLPAIGLLTNSTTASLLAKANLTRIYLQTIYAQAFRQRVAGFVWNAGGWGPYTMIDTSVLNWGTYFPSGDNQITPQGVAFWFQVRAQNGTYFGQFFGAYDLVEGNHTFSPFHPHPQKVIPP